MNVWKPDSGEGGIVQLAHPRTGSESVRHALKDSAGTFLSLEKQHRVNRDHPCLYDPAYQVIAGIRNPFDIVASWYQSRLNMGDDRPLPGVIVWLKEYMQQYEPGATSLFYMLDLAGTVLVTERLSDDWRSKVQSRWPVLPLEDRNHVPRKRPWLNYFVEAPGAIDVMWETFADDIIDYERYLGRAILPR